MFRRVLLGLSLALAPLALSAAPASAQVFSAGDPVRLKDVANVQGARPNQVSGLGIVVGLPGTGDTTQNRLTDTALQNMVERLGQIPITEIQGQLISKNAALVMVTCQLPAFVKPGQGVDVTVSSIGDAKSITNGVLMQTPLVAADGRTYVVAQGAISTGGFASAANGSVAAKNQTTVGRVPNGGLVEREVPVTVVDNTGYLYLNLINPDFTTAARATDSINRSGLAVATALDAGTIRCYVTSAYRDRIPELIGRLESLTVRPDHIAKVVIEERTGTIVLGANTRIDPVALSHGGLVIKIETRTNVSQPAPFSNGTTQVTQESNVTAKEDPAKTLVFTSGATLGQLVKALNALNVTPREMISIIQDIKAAGALNAQLEII